MASTGRNDLFSENYKSIPFWWDTVEAPQTGDRPLPEKVDVLVIGAGYTGLNSAIQTARAGRSTLVVDTEQAGWGCSTRNGGQIGTSLKPGAAELIKRYGADRGRAVHGEGQRSLDWIKQFVAEENISCDFLHCGRFHAAHNSSQFSKLAREAESSAANFDTGAWVVSRDDQQREIGTDTYHGGVVFPQHASLNPASYHAGLVDLALQAGVTIRPHCPAVSIEQEKEGFSVVTAAGRVRAGRVAVATNGYTGSLTPWLHRRVIPIGSYIIATEELPQAKIQQLMPTDRVISDSRKVVYYYRKSPDGKRILFGGRVSHNETDPLISAPRLKRDLVKIFPELADVRVSYSWVGFVAYTFDTLMHLGNRNGLHYAMGYCGSGVGMSSYLGMRMGQQILGLAEGQTGFDDLPFPTRPLYTGKPWFLGPSVMYYRFRDRLNF